MPGTSTSRSTPIARSSPTSPRIAEISPVDAIQSLSPEENPILAQARELLRTTGCCEACVVPVGAVKAMYIVTNLALARDVSLKLAAK